MRNAVVVGASVVVVCVVVGAGVGAGVVSTESSIMQHLAAKSLINLIRVLNQLSSDQRGRFSFRRVLY